MAEQQAATSGHSDKHRDLQPRTLQHCPECGSTDVRYSRKDTLLIAFMKLFHLRRYKCRTCGKRFFGGA